jgi:hypothetical protein
LTLNNTDSIQCRNSTGGYCEIEAHSFNEHSFTYEGEDAWNELGTDFGKYEKELESCHWEEYYMQKTCFKGFSLVDGSYYETCDDTCPTWINNTENFTVNVQKKRQVCNIEVVNVTNLGMKLELLDEALAQAKEHMNLSEDNITKIETDLVAEKIVTNTPKFFDRFQDRKPHYLEIISAHQNGSFRDTEGKIADDYIPNRCKHSSGSYEVACLSEYFIELTLDSAFVLKELKKEHNDLKDCLLLSTMQEIQNCVANI